MRSSLLTFSFLFIGLITVLAQPSNDLCEGAIKLSEVVDWCSDAGAFSNEGATPSGFERASCYSSESNDVWFTFTPVATDITITVIGASNPVSGGTLRRPEIALYTGSCADQINQTECASDVRGNNIVELYKGGMAVGATYLIRIQGAGGQTGTFQICLNNFNPPVNPGADCFDASILCNKEPFVVQQVIGGGDDPTEANDAPCLNGFPGNVESNSTWFSWTAQNDGTLEFTLTPLNPSDDLDFVLYELPNGPQDCQNKFVIRCMASGSFAFPSPCMGPTGLISGDSDLQEPPGCDDPQQNNFLAPIDMEAGKSYALMVNNFSATGNGFKIEFSGTGEFQGPEAAFTNNEPDNTICVGAAISFTDASSFAFGSIVNWTWSFGEDASIPTMTGQGPHTVSYRSAGLKSIVLTIETEKGCIVTDIGTILVECCSDHFTVDGNISPLLCPDDSTGAIALNVINEYGPYAYEWATGSNAKDINGLPKGEYAVTITDAAGCDTTTIFMVDSADPIDFDTLITMPTCNGGTDGAVSLQTTGGTAPYLYNWEKNGFSPDNTLTNLSSGDYSVIVRDSNNCEVSLDIPVRELELILDPVVEAVIPPSCTGFSDGSIEVIISNGRGPFEYNWNDGQGFRDENSLQGIQANVYQVNVLDANLCQGIFTFNMEDPLPLVLNFDVLNASCNGATDGEVNAVVSGGAGNFSYSWSNGQRDSLNTNLEAGTYSVTVLDGNACTIEGNVNIAQPDVIDISLVDIMNVSCNGGATGQISVTGVGGNPPYVYSIDGNVFQPEASFSGLAAGTYNLTVMDGLGCFESLQASVIQPPELIVDAGQDQAITLGFDARLRALANAANVNFQWTPADSLSCIDCPNPRAFPVTTTIYTVVATDDRNCTAMDSVRVSILENRPVYFPNGFSPNGDGSNDYFTLFGGPAAQQIVTMKVFDRWGELVFEKNNLPLNTETAGWDGSFNGRKLDSGVFVFIAEVQFIDGNVITYQGDISLLR